MAVVEDMIALINLVLNIIKYYLLSAFSTPSHFFNQASSRPVPALPIHLGLHNTAMGRETSTLPSGTLSKFLSKNADLSETKQLLPTICKVIRVH